MIKIYRPIADQEKSFGYESIGAVRFTNTHNLLVDTLMINDGRKDIPKYFSDIVILLEGPQPTNILTLYGWVVVKEPRPRVTRPPSPPNYTLW